MGKTQNFPQTAKGLLEYGKLDAEGKLAFEGSSSVCAYIAVIIFLTEPTRLVVRRDGGVGGNLKWHLGDLIDILPFEGRNEKGVVIPTRNIVAACQRNGLVRNCFREVRGSRAANAVLLFRENPPTVLTEIHDVLARRIIEAPLRLIFPDQRKKTSISESLVRQCLLLPYEERGRLASIVWQGAGIQDCPQNVALLTREVRLLSPAHREELRLMLW